MAIVTIGRLAEEIQKLLDGADNATASSISMNELKIAIGQVCNTLLKTDYFGLNGKMGEAIPNGSVLATYDELNCFTWNGVSKCTLPIKPLKLPRNMGIWSVYLTDDPFNEFIPLQMGQSNLIKSQPLVNDLLGQIGYENVGMELIFTKNLPLLFPDKTVSMRLVVMDISQYDDYDPLPILPEMEWIIKQEVYKMYITEPTPDKTVDPTVKENKGFPPKQQSQP